MGLFKVLLFLFPSSSENALLIKSIAIRKTESKIFIDFEFIFLNSFFIHQIDI